MKRNVDHADPTCRNRCGATTSPYKLLIHILEPWVTRKNVPNGITVIELKDSPMLVSIVQWVVSCLARNQFLQPINEGKTQNSRLVKHCIDLLKVGNSLTRKDSSNTCLELGMVISCWFRLVILCDLRPFYSLLIGRWLEKCR